MKDYLKKNLKSRQIIKGAHAPNVEAEIFRLHGRVLSKIYNLPGKKKLLHLSILAAVKGQL